MIYLMNNLETLFRMLVKKDINLINITMIKVLAQKDINLIIQILLRYLVKIHNINLKI